MHLRDIFINFFMIHQPCLGCWPALFYGASTDVSGQPLSGSFKRFMQIILRVLENSEAYLNDVVVLSEIAQATVKYLGKMVDTLGFTG